MMTRNMVVGFGVAVCLALPVAPSLAAGKGDHGGRERHGDKGVGALRGHGRARRGLRQFEGRILTVAPGTTSFVLETRASHSMTVTVDITTSTRITVDDVVTTTSVLTPTERVHVAALGTPGTDGAYVAKRVVVQSPEPKAAETPEATETPEPESGSHS